MSYQYPPQYPPPYPPQYPPPPPQTSGAAIISLIASLSAFVLFPVIGSIVGIIAGNSAKNDIRNRPGQVTGEGLAQAGVILGWIGLGLWGLGCCAAVIGFAFFGLTIPSIGICAELNSGDPFSWLQLIPLASLVAVPAYIKFKS